MKFLIWYYTTLVLECMSVTNTEEILNLALGKPASSSSRHSQSTSVLVDGRSDTIWGSGSCFATGHGDLEPWWMVDLEAYHVVTGFKVINRGDCCEARLSNFKTEVFTDNPVTSPNTCGRHCYFYAGTVARGASVTLSCDVPVVGRFFRISRRLSVSTDLLQLCELEVYGKPITPSCRFRLGPFYKGILASRCRSTYSATMDIRMTSSDNTHIAVNTPPDCANNCSMLTTCLGFNFKQAVGCEMVSGFSRLSHSPDWKYYSRGAC